jgi:hypothetical protein
MKPNHKLIKNNKNHTDIENLKEDIQENAIERAIRDFEERIRELEIRVAGIEWRTEENHFPEE